MFNVLRSVLYSWQATLEYLSRANIRYFLFASFRALAEIYKGLSWRLFVVFFLSLLFGLYFTLFYSVCAARSSVDAKNGIYFETKFLQNIGWHFLFCVLISFLSVGFSTSLHEGLPEWASPLTLLLRLHIVSYIILFTFFLFDSLSWFDAIIRSPLRAFSLLFYTYPVSIGLGALILGIRSLLFTSSGLFEFSLVNSLFLTAADLVFISLYVAAMSTLYIRRTYEQGIYF